MPEEPVGVIVWGSRAQAALTAGERAQLAAALLAIGADVLTLAELRPPGSDVEILLDPIQARASIVRARAAGNGGHGGE